MSEIFYEEENYTTKPPQLLRYRQISLTDLLDEAIEMARMVQLSIDSDNMNRRQRAVSRLCKILSRFNDHLSGEKDSTTDYQESLRHLVQLFMVQSLQLYHNPDSKSARNLLSVLWSFRQSGNSDEARKTLIRLSNEFATQSQ